MGSTAAAAPRDDGRRTFLAPPPRDLLVFVREPPSAGRGRSAAIRAKQQRQTRSLSGGRPAGGRTETDASAVRSPTYRASWHHLSW